MKIFFLTPEEAPNSSLVHMFKVVRKCFGGPETAFLGRVSADGSWSIDLDCALSALEGSTCGLAGNGVLLVHLLDHSERGRRVDFPSASFSRDVARWRKGRSREVPKPQLRDDLGKFLWRFGVKHCRQNTSELSSQAYEHTAVSSIFRPGRGRGLLPENRR